MPVVQTQNKERLSFFVNRDLFGKVTEISKLTNQNISEIAREALRSYADQIEQERIDRELEEGYKSNYKYYLKSEKEWEYADKE